MTPETLEALKASIAKWERNAVAETPAQYLSSADECPLCDLFFWQADDCAGCPVRAKTGRIFCSGTPYGEANDANYKWRVDGGQHLQAKAHEAALAEVAFLKSLLPPEEQVP